MSAFPHPVEGYQLSLDYEQSVFFLSPQSKTSENGHKHDWRREASEAAPVFHSSTLARMCTPLTLLKSEEKERLLVV